MTNYEQTLTLNSAEQDSADRLLKSDLSVNFISRPELYESLSTQGRELVDWALDQIEYRYGANGQTPLQYQNEVHTVGVITATDYLADSLGLNGYDKEDLLVTAAFHDIEHAPTHVGDNDERNSVRVAAEKMREIGIGENRIRRMDRGLMATVATFVDGGIHHPNVSDDIETKILADADMAHLGNLGETSREAFRDFFWNSRSLGLWSQIGRAHV